MVVLEQRPERVQTPLAAAPMHVWTLAGGAPWAEFHRHTDGIMVRFPGLADFEVATDGGRVTCTAAPGTTAATIEHLYLNQVLPLALGKQGRLVFHASAVEVPGGAVAFLAQSGRGKSTLATAFAVSGHRFLTDDSLVLEAGGHGYIVQPGHPSLRLWHDSEARLAPKQARKAAAVSYTDKARLLAGPGLAHSSEAQKLLAVYVLEDGAATGVAITPVTPAAALMQWTRHSFLLDVHDRELIAGQFERAAALAECVACYTLDYPREYDFLGRVVESVVAHSRLKSAA